MRLGVLTSHPIQYQAPLFRELAARPGLSLRVYFCDDHGVRPTLDQGFGRTFQYDVPLLEGYEHEFLPNISRNPRVASTGLINPRILEIVTRREVDALVLYGYSAITNLLALASVPRRARLLLWGDSNSARRPAPWKRAAKQIVLRALFRRIDVFLSCGSLNATYYKRYGVSDARLVHAPFSVDNDYFRQGSERARQNPGVVRARLGLPMGGPLFVFAGKLMPLKRPLDIVRAFSQALESGPAALAIVGDGELRSSIDQELRSSSLRGRAVALGFKNQSELPEIFGATDAVILASDTEAWGLVVNEAMACGATAIVSDQVGCWPDLVDPQNVFPCGDVRALARIMAEVIRSPESLRASKARAVSRISTWGLRETADGFVAGAQLALERSQRPR